MSASTGGEKVGVFFYGLHKSGTTFVFSFLRHLCRQLDVRFHSRNGHTVRRNTELHSDIAESFCLGPVRNFDLEGGALSDCGHRNFPHIDRLHHIIQIRDPRDVLVSLFFSEAHIHRPYRQMDIEDFLAYRQRVNDMGIDRYVLEQATRLTHEYDRLARADWRAPNLHFVKYETMVGDLHGWICRMVAPFGVAADSELVRRLHHRFAPEMKVGEEQLKHKRRVTPGDHIEKLKPATIRKLNAIFRKYPFLNYNFPTLRTRLLRFLTRSRALPRVNTGTPATR